MNRKSQYYLVTVVIICIAIFSFLTITTARPRAASGTFMRLLDNCYEESTYVMNQAIKNNENMFNAIENFADDFKTYSQRLDTEFGFVYLVTNSAGNTRIVNMLEPDMVVYVDTDNLSTNISQSEHITDTTDSVELIINNNKYIFDSTRAPNMQFLFWESKEGDIRVKQK